MYASVVWQSGGGVYIDGGTVTLNNCDIYSNTAYSNIAFVSARLLNLP